MDNLWIIYGYGWWLSHPSEKYEFVNWDDEIPNIMERKMFQTTNQLFYVTLMEDGRCLLNLHDLKT